MKRVLTLLLALAMTASLAACGEKNTGSSSAAEGASSAAQSGSQPASSEAASQPQEGDPVAITFPLGKPVEDRADTAQRITDALNGAGAYADCPVALIETSEGAVRVRLFPQEAPRTVENFITHARDGYYDGVPFHRVINDFMIQGGDPTGTGAGGESIYGDRMEDEFSDVLHNFRGAVSMANTGDTSTNGSQFFIVQSKRGVSGQQRENALFTMYFQRELYNAQLEILQRQKDGASKEELDKLVEELNAQLTEKQKAGTPQEFADKMAPAMDRYQEGGASYLDYMHTVFGYVIEGMDVVDAIAALDTGETDATGQPAGKTSRPVTIEKITIEEPAAG